MINDITTGLRVATQRPLNPKEYATNEATLANLGTDNNLAFTYHLGMRVYAIEEQSVWEWREPGVDGEVPLITPDNYTYPAGLIVDGVDYGNKEYNFFKILQADEVAAGLITYQIANIPGLGQGVYFNTTNPSPNVVQFNLKRFRSNNLSITATDDEILIETPMTASIPALYVNNLYIPTYPEWLTENALQNGGTPVLGFVFRGRGTLAQPFTDSVVYPLLGGSPTTTPNTAIQNALDGDSAYDIPYSYVGTGTRLAPERIGQRIIVQNNNSFYTHIGDYNYTNIKIHFQCSVLNTTNSYIIDMDNPLYFDTDSSVFEISIDENLVFQCDNSLGFRNSGNTSSLPPAFDTGRIGIFLGEGAIYFNYSGVNILSRYIFNGDGNTNDNNLHFLVKCKVRADQQGIYFSKNKNAIDFYNSVQSGVLSGTGNIDLKAFHMTGGQIRLFEKGNIYLGNEGTGRTYGLTFEPTDLGIGSTIFSLGSAEVSGRAEKCFAKLNNENVQFTAFNSASGRFGTFLVNTNTITNGLFENLGVDKWSIDFKNNVFSYTGIDQTKVDLTGGNGISVINFIGNEVIENLVMFPSKTAAIAAGHPANSAFIRVENVSANDLQSGVEYKITTVGVPALGTLGDYFIATGTETGTGVGTLYTREVII